MTKLAEGAHSCERTLHDMPQGARRITPHPQDKPAMVKVRKKSKENVRVAGQEGSKGPGGRHWRGQTKESKPGVSWRSGPNVKATQPYADTAENTH
jgi:hypothetical protein